MTRPFLAIAAAAMLTSIAAWADDADRHKAFNDFLELRPDKCKEVTARVVQATGGAFKAGGRRDDSIEIAGKPYPRKPARGAWQYELLRSYSGANVDFDMGCYGGG